MKREIIRLLKEIFELGGKLMEKVEILHKTPYFFSGLCNMRNINNIVDIFYDYMSDKNFEGGDYTVDTNIYSDLLTYWYVYGTKDFRQFFSKRRSTDFDSFIEQYEKDEKKLEIADAKKEKNIKEGKLLIKEMIELLAIINQML